MTERCSRMRSSFVNVGNKRRPAAFFVVLIFVLLILSGCNRTGPEDSVSENRINSTPEEVSRVYAESVFTGNYLLMFKCYPREFVVIMQEDDLSKFASWSTQIKESLLFNDIEFHGTDARKSEWTGDLESVAYRNAVAGIEEKFGVSSDDVTEINKCDVSLYFSRDNEDMYQKVSVISYRIDDQWYVYQMESLSA